MTKVKSIKKALFSSFLSLILCFSMLIGTTFAWFTDSVSSANNIIKSGNLDIELEYWKDGKWVDVNGQSDIITNTLWEPGVTEVAYLRVANAGSLALKYQLGINIVSETEGLNVLGEEFLLSDYIYFDVVEGIAVDADKKPDVYETREDALAAVQSAEVISAGYDKADGMAAGEELYLALIVYMPEEVGNEANHVVGTYEINNEQKSYAAPYINLGINVIATQLNSETDSFDKEYDKESRFPIPVAPEGVTEFEEETNFGKLSFSIPQEAVAEGTSSINTLIKLNKKAYQQPEDINDTLKYVVDLDIKLDGLKENGVVTVTYTFPEGEDYVGAEVYHNGVKVDGATFDAATRSITFNVTSFSPFTFIGDTGAIVIPEEYTNDEAVAMIKNAAAGARIDGNGRVIGLGTAAQNSWALSLTKSVYFSNMTLKANGKGQVIIIQGKNQTVKMKNVVVQNTNYSGQSLVLSLNGATSQIFENCTFKGKAYFQGSNATFVNCSFDKNNNMDSSATNFSFIGCKFTNSSAITVNAKAKNILVENCTFSGSAFRIYKGMAQPENVRLINNTYKGSKLVTPDAGIDYEGWKANGAWIEEGNTKI